MPDRPTTSRIQRFALNEAGRDFVVGDIHGMFQHLQAALTDVGFDEQLDRLFSVGDLVDRGPFSSEAVHWLAQPWFHACRGNHEHFAINSTDEQEARFWIHNNGGEWWQDLSDHDQREYRRIFADMPLAMEVETRSGRVGIVHADVPPSVSWERFLELLEVEHPDVLMYALFSRNRIQGSVSTPVSGDVDRLYCGHTPVRQPVLIDNIYYIDTGAVYGQDGYENARLTLVEIHPQRHLEHFVHYQRLF